MKYVPRAKHVKLARSSKSSVRGSINAQNNTLNDDYAVSLSLNDLDKEFYWVHKKQQQKKTDTMQSFNKRSDKIRDNGTHGVNRLIIDSKMDENELEEVKQRSEEIAEKRSCAESKLTAEALQRFEADQVSNKQSIKSIYSRRSQVR